MSIKKRYVSALVARGGLKEDGIVMSLYGYRGGSVCTVEMNLLQATALRDQLDEAIELMNAHQSSHEREMPW